MEVGSEERGQNENKKDLSEEFGAAFFPRMEASVLLKQEWVGVLAMKAISSHYSAGSENVKRTKTRWQWPYITSAVNLTILISGFYTGNHKPLYHVTWKSILRDVTILPGSKCSQTCYKTITVSLRCDLFKPEGFLPRSTTLTSWLRPR